VEGLSQVEVPIHVGVRPFHCREESSRSPGPMGMPIKPTTEQSLACEYDSGKLPRRLSVIRRTLGVKSVSLWWGWLRSLSAVFLPNPLNSVAAPHPTSRDWMGRDLECT